MFIVSIYKQLNKRLFISIFWNELKDLLVNGTETENKRCSSELYHVSRQQPANNKD